MKEPLTPQAIETLSAGYVVGDLDASELEVFEQLLAENPGLLPEVDRLKETLNQVMSDFNYVSPPSHLRSAILANAIPQTPSQPAKRRRDRFPWRTMMGSVAALLILYLGIENHQLRQDYRLTQTINSLLQQPQTQLFSLKPVNNSANPSTNATGSFVVNLGQRQGVLSAQNLATPPAGKLYRLWAIADGEKIPCGTLKINPQGKVLDQFWMPADFYDTGISGLFVTLESSDTDRYPTGPIVLQSQISSNQKSTSKVL
jgi:anti-sigma-K factor RskA